jgi:hypothetical protein
MRLAISSPTVTALPESCGAWEANAGIEGLAAIMVEADRLGYDHVTCSEHVMVPSNVAAPTGTRWPPSATWPPGPNGSGSPPRS